MLAIFDMSSVNIARYNSEIIKNYANQCVAYVDDPEDCVEIDGLEVTLICSGGWSIRKIISSFKRYSISAVLISGQRPADFRVMIAANKANISIIYKMHGLYVEHAKRRISFYVLRLKKVVRTVRYLLDIAFFTRSALTPGGIALSFIFGFHRGGWMNLDSLRIDHGLVWSKYWILWHERQWGMSPRYGWEITGNPDSIKFKRVQTEAQSFCYIYQTLVEDGKISRSVMDSFYDDLAEISRNQKKIVNVKWHIRGNVSVRNSLEKRGFRIYDEFPIGKIYVGHSSSLLGVVPVIGGSLIVFELKGLDTPVPIRRCATLTTNDIQTLEKGIASINILDNNKISSSIYYFGDHYSQNVENSIISQYVNEKEITPIL